LSALRLQKLSLSFGLTCSTPVAGCYLGDLPQTDHVAMIRGLHHAVLTPGLLTIASSLAF